VKGLYPEPTKELVELQNEPAQMPLRVHRGNHEIVRETAAGAHVERDRFARLSIIEEFRDLFNVGSSAI
jgi:hypothetical protein